MKNQKTYCVVALLTMGLLAGLLGCESNYRLREDGRMATYHRDYDLAAEKYGLAAEREPDDFMAQYELGKTYLLLGRPVSAQMSFEKGLAVKPDDKEWTPKFIDGIAESFYQQKRYEQLASYLKDKAEYYGRPRDYIRQGKYLAMIGSPDEAVLAYKKAAHFSSKGDASAYVAIAEFYESIQDLENARIALRYAYFVDADYPGLDDDFRKLGMIPGPTMRLEPPKPAMLQ
ncbi:tetratricopeptide repeat protein [Poriferisphaera sp. WC338]|uniref:tetratricopeptide repeat protein n=1 Tax=Poriferisphaera sp. WC338 TaxID=3425129 RepID=UPI003D814036